MRTLIQEMSRRPGFPVNLMFSEVDCFNDKMLATLRKKVKENINSAQLRGQKIMGGLVPHSYMVRGGLDVDVEHKMDPFAMLRTECYSPWLSKSHCLF